MKRERGKPGDAEQTAAVATESTEPAAARTEGLRGGGEEGGHGTPRFLGAALLFSVLCFGRPSVTWGGRGLLGPVGGACKAPRTMLDASPSLSLLILLYGVENCRHFLLL